MKQYKFQGKKMPNIKNKNYLTHFFFQIGDFIKFQLNITL